MARENRCGSFQKLGHTATFSVFLLLASGNNASQLHRSSYDDMQLPPEQQGILQTIPRSFLKMKSDGRGNDVVMLVLVVALVRRPAMMKKQKQNEDDSDDF